VLAREDRLEDIPVISRPSVGVGPAIAESVAKFFSDARNRSVLERLAAAGVAMVESTEGDRKPEARRQVVRAARGDAGIRPLPRSSASARGSRQRGDTEPRAIASLAPGSSPTIT
jgi:NAD-dependent DNA ligase